jgi:hypothetical protein
MLEASSVFPFFNHSNRRVGYAAAILLGLAIAGGCNVFDAERWDLNRYRDQRAVDVDQRLGQDRPMVENPF